MINQRLQIKNILHDIELRVYNLCMLKTLNMLRLTKGNFT